MTTVFRSIPFVAVFAGAVSVTAPNMLGTLKAALPSAEQIVFQVFRDDDTIGRHTVEFSRQGDDLHVDIDIFLEVNFAFLTLYRYQHQNREVWRGGRLVSIDTATDDDGDTYWVRGEMTEAGLKVEGSSGSFVAPADILPTSYWNADSANKSQFLDTQHGQLIDVSVSPVGTETISVAGRATDAHRYSVRGDLNLDLWYTADGEWAKTSFEARGAEVSYVRLGAFEELGTAQRP